MFLLGLLLSSFNLAYSLHCTDNCSMIYPMNELFIMPPNCSYVSANHCSVKLIFWYDRGNYNVTFIAESSYDNHIDDNKHFVMIEVTGNKFFSYDIHHICKETDDCARSFAEEKIIQMTKRSYNVTNIYSDLRRLIHQKSTLSSDLACFDINDGVRQCTVPGTSGSCQIVDDLIKHKFHKRLCLHSTQQSTSLNIFDTGSVAMMTVRCNRMLCNGPLTIAAVKKILQHHNITDINDRLLGSSAKMLLSRYLLALTMFVFFF
ncbi:unnamed protein product [Rotaria socialis]|uniref:Uncharacterized protein n=1 Tax=Rotaria socialis TaxID=392032 RepID=A0A820TGG1_9BILA|nr:unnamed protein product [Rotaria socialis]CAF3409168.1 unnamed protein product [Rotaria socialis]CAF4206169.1 unnamed protein product [Rotaria socialis]CAF4466318.1 unnamed protein product [Rotaria socialis]